jgi:UDP-N-acetylglucosamine diphosphorylase / glucose-1-phosphate thymidylyltransferase / UDP-N-acetylgalactosamine diphosphorylase / glucosamine-1-phosphate N-acetyltransferase / galactosamine-1-phosphate N-acetyltransferase
MRTMPESMQYRIDHGTYDQQQDGVFLARGASIGQYAVIDTSRGPIILEEDVHVGPFCYLSGPVHIGARTRVIEHAALKRRLPQLAVMGGCCGTDERHIREIAAACRPLFG